ncbi:MAG: M23 family metallopeptidase [Actinobacteria bacterium]|nr:M23 family metallopeptidase [Actinomycetota bacterium]
MISPGTQKLLFAEESASNNNNIHDTERKTKVPFIIPLDGRTCIGFREEYFDKEKKVIRKHTGIDIAGEFNQVVSASGNGIVTYIGLSPIGGRTIVIRHNAKIRTTYLNLLNIYVSIGDYIQQGEIIATIGADDDPSSLQNTHLHFGIIYDDFYLDPTDIFKISYINISSYIILKYLEEDFRLR